MAEQLELFSSGPFTVRLSISDAISFFWEHWWKFTKKGPNTRKVLKRISTFFANRYVDDISKSDVEAFRRHLTALGLKQNTVNTHHMILTRLYNKLYEWQEAKVFEGMDFTKITLPKHNPGAQIKKVNENQFRRKVAWPKRLVYRLTRVASAVGDQDLAEIILMLYMTKLRPGDLLKITDRNVDLPRMILSGIQSKTKWSKMPSGVPYLIALTPSMVKILERRMTETESGKPLFKGPYPFIYRRFMVVTKAANLSHVQLRDFRPSAATLLMDNGVDPESVADSLGHTTLRMLPAYAPRKLVHQRRAQKILEKDDTEIIF